MRLRIALLVLVLVFVSTLVGCGSSGFSSWNNTPGSTADLVSIAIGLGSPAVNVGATEQLTATGFYSDGSSKNITSSVKWSSSASSIASISNSGLLTGAKGGSATITAKSGTISKTVSVTVDAVLQSLVVSSTSNTYSATAGSSVQWIATADYNDGTSKNVTAKASWTTTNSSVATVSSSGEVMAVRAGTASIQATYSSKMGSANLTVNPAGPILSSIVVGPNPANVNLGSTLQLSAIGHYSDNSSSDLTSSVVWSSSDKTKVTVNSVGLSSGVADGKVTITATSGLVSGAIAVTVNPVLQSISLNPAGPAVLVGGVQPFKASGAYNDGSMKDISATVSWSSSDSTKASIDSNGNATGLVSGPITITATLGSVSGTTALNVVSSVYAQFVGRYAFALTSADTRGASFFAGALAVDGAGDVSGVEDCNAATGVQQNVPLTGTSVVYPDGRGNIALNQNLCQPNGITLRIMLTGAGSSGSAVEVDAFGEAKGTLRQQDSGALSTGAINGNYVFRMSGMDATANPSGEVGLFAADGAGNINSGLLDVNDNGALTSYTSLNPSTYSVDSNGRGVLQLNSGSLTSSFTFYVIDATSLVFIETDPSFAASGIAALQAVAPFSAGSLVGSYAFLADRPLVAQPGQDLDLLSYAQIGDISFDGISAIDGRDNDLHDVGTYAISTPTAFGRGSFTGTTSDNTSTFIFYIVSPSRIFLLLSSTLPTWQSANLVTGEADLQTGMPYSVATLAGTYVMHSSDPIANYAGMLLWFNFDGLGEFTGIADVAQNGQLASTVISNPSYTYTPAADGRAEVHFSVGTQAQDCIFFIVSPQSAWIHGVTYYLDGSIDQQ